jgi:Sulfotransferase family
MLPNFFVVGAAKCGTTSLALYMGLHPEIHIPSLSEARFFAEPDPLRPFPGRRVDDLHEYEALFESDLPMRGEVCGSYSQYPWRRGVPGRIHEMVDEPRFIYIVGDPVKRVESHYVQLLAEEDEGRSIDEVLGDIEASEHPVICPGRYAEQLEQYLAMFSSQDMLVIDQDDLLQRRRPTLERLFTFLGVDAAYWTPEFDAMRNRGADHRRLSSGLYGRLRQSGLRQAIDVAPPAIRAPLLRSARHLLTAKVTRPLLDTELRARLEKHYAPDVESLRKLTGMAFDGWSL